MVETTRKKETVKILSEKRISNFKVTDIKLGRLKVFKDKSQKVLEILEENRKEIQRIAESCRVDVVLTCSKTYFKHIISNTKAHEIEAELFITKDRKMMHYAIFGFEPTVLLLALDE